MNTWIIPICQWKDDGTYYWQECCNCDYTTKADKKTIPDINISIQGADKVCRTNDYVFSFEIPEGCENGSGYINLGTSSAEEPVVTEENGVVTLTAPAACYRNVDSFAAVATVTLKDGYPMQAKKQVQIGHTALQRFEAKATTKDAPGNIEYWCCKDCGKYYSDEAAQKEITQADTVIAKLTADKSLATGDEFNMTVMLALLIAAGGGFAGVYRRRQVK